MSDVLVVGGGWAGLAAALTLARAGVAVTLLEAAPRLGGRARSVRLGGVEVDCGQHLLLGAYRQTLALLDLVGTKRLLARLPLRLDAPPEFRLSVSPLPAPWHLAAGLLCARGLSVRARLRAAAFYVHLRTRGFRVDAEETVTALAARLKQPPVAMARLWTPLCLAALNTPPERASAQVFSRVLALAFGERREDSDLLFPRVGLSALFPEPAARDIAAHGGVVHTGTRVLALRPEAPGFRVSTPRGEWFADQVVLATAPWHAARLLSELAPEVAARLARLTPEPIETVYLRYGHETRLPFPMLGLTDGPGQWVFDRGGLGLGPGLLAVVVSGAGPHAAMATPALVAAIEAQLAPLTGGVRGEFLGRIREKRATFAAVPGRPRPDYATGVPGLWLAGDYLRHDLPATLEAASLAGVECARRILESSP